MKREELLTDAMLFFSPNERSITAENGARYYREDVVLKAMELAGKESSLPPAEGAEKAQRCPVCMGRGLVPNSFYATTGGIGSTTQTYLPEKCRTCNGAGVIILPYPKLQPTAEGAEEIQPTAYEWHNLKTGHCYVDYVPHLDAKEGYTKIPLYTTLHAQQMAEKMVEEKCKKCKYRGLPDSIQEALNSGDGVYRP